jgi:twitching motility two-component system response regulator PilG
MKMAKRKILIADDDPDFLKVEERFLTQAGYEVLCAQDAYRALHLAINELPNLVLLDVNMPAGNGPSVHQRISLIPICCSIPVIYVTGQRSQAVINMAREMNAFAVLYKPFDFEDMLKNVRGALGEGGFSGSGPHFSADVSWAVASEPPKLHATSNSMIAAGEEQ